MTDHEWGFDEATGCWQATIGGWVATIRDDVGHDTYLVALKPQGGQGPLHLAPLSFDELAQAQDWCVAEVERLRAETIIRDGVLERIATTMGPQDPQIGG